MKLWRERAVTERERRVGDPDREKRERDRDRERERRENGGWTLRVDDACELEAQLQAHVQ